jgi:hypothetical protein
VNMSMARADGGCCCQMRRAVHMPRKPGTPRAIPSHQCGPIHGAGASATALPSSARRPNPPTPSAVSVSESGRVSRASVEAV